MKRYADAGEQLVIELYVRNLKESCESYRGPGFEAVRDAGDCVELKRIEPSSEAPDGRFRMA